MPTTRKPPPTTLPGHTYTTLKSRTWREEKRESRRVEKARKGGRTKKHTRGSIGFFGLQCIQPVKERQRKTEKDRERQKAAHTHTLKPRLRHASPNLLNSAAGPGFGPKIWHQVWSCSEGPLEWKVYYSFWHQSKVWMGTKAGTGRHWTHSATLALERRGNMAPPCPSSGNPGATWGQASPTQQLQTLSSQMWLEKQNSSMFKSALPILASHNTEYCAPNDL